MLKVTRKQPEMALCGTYHHIQHSPGTPASPANQKSSPSSKTLWKYAPVLPWGCFQVEVDTSEHDPGCLAPHPGGNTISAMCRQVGSNELHLRFWVTNTLSIFKNGYFYSYFSKFFGQKNVLLLRYCGRRSSRYFILMQYK